VAGKEKKEKERDWDREMAEVDKLLARLPEADPTLGRGVPTVPRSPRPSGPAAAHGASHPGGGSAAATWLRLGLGLALGIGMLVWPYSHICGVKEMFYLTGVGAVIVAGLWSGVSSWRRRLGFAHVLSQVLLIWGLVLAAREVLPRVGYAKTGGTFFCPEPPVQLTPRR
jgi:hypothetical protein